MLPRLTVKSGVEDFIRKTFANGIPEDVEDEDEKELLDARIDRLLQQLAKPPAFTTLRINSRLTSRDDAKQAIQQLLTEQYERKDWLAPEVCFHADIPDMLVVPSRGPHQVEPAGLAVTVDLLCGMAVLRGADVFAQGIMGAAADVSIGAKVAIYCDVQGKCPKGWMLPFEGSKVFVGNGIAKMNRHSLFCNRPQNASGLAVQLTEPLYDAPALNDLLPRLVFPQNLPSAVCAHELMPRPGDRVLDMCASPGGKTTHIATLMNNQGTVIALDKSAAKIDKVNDNAASWKLTCIRSYAFDSTKACDIVPGAEGAPPYPPECFDRVLVDVPCSGLGQRPSVYCRLTLKEISSYSPLQRKLLTAGIELLKVGGTLVYSTCTVPAEENERQVAHALKTFPQLHLVPQTMHLGGPGLAGCGLTEEQRRLVQRFDPSDPHCHQKMVNTDTIGFFIAKFIKTATTTCPR